MFVVTLGTKPPVRLDACSYCGGVWTDQSEANFFKESDLVAIGIPPKHIHSVKTPASRLCPKDSTVLDRFRGESVPEGVMVFHCATCGGSWFPAGNIRKFKRAQSVKLAFFKTWHLPLPSTYAILLPVFLILIITGSIVVTVRSIQEQQQLESQARGLISKPVVRNVSSSEVFISFTTQKPLATSLTYWNRITPTEKKTVTVSTRPQTVHIIRLSGLSPTINYMYQITLGTVPLTSTEVFIFTTGEN